jgi:class 3 adenylate cyclase/tetratricopeptide (TPR) repeat protein
VVKCHNCGHENTPGARFCSQCGNSLSYPCPVCGTIASPEDKFCRNCGTAFGESAGTTPPRSPTDDLGRYLPEELLDKMRSVREGHSMEGERRTVTMLFADVQGSTSSAEQLDPEDWAEIMNGAFERLISPIYRYEGTLAQLRGDAVLAFFGAPIAHEDDPVRALRAGLDIVAAMAAYSEDVERRWSVPAHVRVGINTGLVVVGAMGSDLRVEYTALGDAINVAARMEQTAERDTVRVTGHTLSLTQGLFEAEELGPIDVKGKADPVPAYRVLRYVGTGPTKDAAPLVGRAEELGLLEEARDHVTESTGRIVTVIAEAGVGKTRLLDEFESVSEQGCDVARRFDADGDINWLHGSSRSYDSSNHYATIADALGGWWFNDRTNPSFDRVEAAVALEHLDDPDAAAYLGFIAGVPLPEPVERFINSLETQTLNTKANQAARAYIAALAARRPTLIVLEDLHWADDLSLALVEVLMDVAETAPFGLVLVMRPYRDESSWRIREVAERDHPHRYVGVSLAPLDTTGSSDLLDTLLEGIEVDAGTRQGILERSQGNPLYIEQMARSLRLQPDDLAESQLPTSLSGLLTARLDRLDEHERYLVQMASVLGSAFDRSMLAALVEATDIAPTVNALLRVGILAERPGSRETLEFRHALIQEAAYETILRRTRRQLHRRVADHLIAGDGASREIARHLVAADELEPAYPYLVSAGVAATRSMALADAIELLTTAIDNTPDDADPELIVQAHDGLGDAYALIPDLSQAAASYQKLFDYGEDSQRPEAQVAALNRLAYATASIGADLEKAHQYLADARRIAEENHDEMGLAEYHMNACFVASMRGDPGTAVAHDEETVRLGQQTGVKGIQLMGMVRRATNYVALLDWDRAMPAIESALEEATESGYEEAVATVRFSGPATIEYLKGHLLRSLEEAEESLAVLDRYGSFFLGMAHHTVGSCHFEMGNLEEALSHYLDVVRVSTQMGQPFTSASGASSMALVYATVGMHDQISQLVSEAEEQLGGPLGEFLASTVLADIGFVRLLQGEPEKAVDDFTRGLRASSTSQFMERPRLLVGRAMARAAFNDLEPASKDLVDAVSLAESKDLGLYLASIGLAEGLISMRSGDLEGAEHALTRGQEEAMSRGQRVRLQQILAARARVASLLDLDDEAERHSESALSVAEAIAEGIADETLRSSFLATSKQALASET